VTSYDDLMLVALDQAGLAPPHGDVPVGAVVVGPDRSVLGVGHNDRERTGDPTAHAEVVALRAAAAAVGSWRLTGCTLVVTLEPCTMCGGAAGSLFAVVRDRRLNCRPEVVPGVLADRCAAVLLDFFETHRAPR
jgi:tRNA(adenine34) deaminase